jgi:hypothetical protein
LFVAGCARSGTTALALLLNRHPDIAIGIERFIHLALRRQMSPALFNPERFCRIQPGDTHYSAFTSTMAAVGLPFRVNTASIIGDKVPRYFDVYDHMHSAFPGARFLFIVRDIRDVAASYKRRLLNGSWARDVSTAVAEWNRSIRQTIEYQRRLPFCIVRYEQLLTEDCTSRIAAFLDVDIGPFLRALPDFIERSAKLDLTRSPVLSADDLDFIEQNADRQGYRALLPP